MAKKKTHEYFIEKYKSKFPESSVVFLEKYGGSKKQIKCKCTIHNIVWYTTPESLYQGAGCLKCKSDKLINYHKQKHNHEWFVDKFYSCFPDKPISFLSEYVNSHDKIKCKCGIDGYIWEITPNALLNGEGCPKCANRATRTKEELIRDFDKIYRGYYIILSDSLDGYKNCHSIIKVKNIKTNSVFSSTPEKLLNTKVALDVLEKFGDGEIRDFNELLRLQLLPWKNASKKIYNNRCILTNSTQNLVVHHLNKNFSEIRDEVFMENNITKIDTLNLTIKEAQILITQILEKHFWYGYGVPLNKELHDEFHIRYGKNNNSIDQFIEFAKMKGYSIKVEQLSTGENKLVNMGGYYDPE